MRGVCSIVALVMCACSAFAHGEEASLFPQGMWDIEAFGGYASEVYPDDHQKITTATLGVGYYVKDNFAVSLQLPGYRVKQVDDHADAIGFNLSLRYHFYQADRFSFFADIIGGLSEASREVPPGGTHFNFTLQFGPGVTYELVEHVHLFGGARLFHLSNAAIEGISRNPDLNAVEGYAGVLFTF